ncbi:MAG: pilus assembly protein TadG-related protein [Silvibacterium sp.]
MKFLRDEKGQVLVIGALSMMVLLAFMALATDVGLLFRAKRNAQIAADAAAVAGTLDYKYNASVSSAQAAGQAAATANGITNGVGGAVVTINVPPKNGPNQSLGFVEAIITQPNSTTFMSIFGHSAVSVAARAVAGAGTTDGCVWALGKSGVDIPISGSGSINVPTCGVYDNSSASDALNLTGSGSIKANSIGIVGGYADSGSGSIQICNPGCTNSNPTTGIAPVASPITLTPPTVPTSSAACTGTGPGGVGCSYSCSGSANCTIGPGTYTSITNSGSGKLTLTAGNYNVTGSLSNTGSGGTTLGAGNVIVNGCLCDTGSGNLTTGAGSYTMGTFTSSGSSSLTLGSGLYITTGTQSLTGSGALDGTGVTFFTEGSTTVSGSGSMDLTAPLSGPYNGIVFYQPANDSDAINLSGSGSMTLEGIVYAPDSPLTITGSGSGNIYTDFIVDSLTLSGSGSFNSKQYQLINASALLGKIVMVE